MAPISQKLTQTQTPAVWMYKKILTLPMIYFALDSNVKYTSEVLVGRTCTPIDRALSSGYKCRNTQRAAAALRYEVLSFVRQTRASKYSWVAKQT